FGSWRRKWTRVERVCKRGGWLVDKRNFVKQALSEWLQEDGPDDDVVLSSRVRLARNMRGLPFPMLATPAQSKIVADQLLGVAENGLLNGLGPIELIKLGELTELEKLVRVEKHLISPNLANESRNGALILSQNED